MNPIVYAEVSIGFDRIEDLDRVLPETMIRREPLPYAAGFLAGKAFMLYRRRGGAKSRPMPDFYIGAHAAVAGYRLLTRDAQRYLSSSFCTLLRTSPSTRVSTWSRDFRAAPSSGRRTMRLPTTTNAPLVMCDKMAASVTGSSGGVSRITTS